MNAFEKVLHFLMAECETPPSFGWFHIVSFIIFIAFTVVVCIKLSRASDKAYRTFALVCWVILAVGEIYRELCFSFSVTDGVGSWDYAWYQFPFQICSGPLYLLLPIAFLKDGKVRNALMAYTATFSLFGGLAVMIYPNDVFCYFIGINIQSLVHHGLQATVGILTLIRLKDKLNYKTLLASMSVFVCALAIAMTLNLSVHPILVGLGRNDTFNMFFISPYHGCHIPILSLIREATPYGVFLPCYIIGFGAVAAIMLYGGKGIIMLTERIINRYRKNQPASGADDKNPAK